MKTGNDSWCASGNNASPLDPLKTDAAATLYRVSIYVEILIRAPLDEVWRRTQEPAQHEPWDLRFTHIEYLPRPDPSEPQRFRYSTRIGFGLCIEGAGESVGTVDGNHGERTSALRFWSEDGRSLIREGSGYWRYVPVADGVRFLTAYDYEPRFGAVGRLVDRLLFRPLLGWATAFSFDRLRLWIERGLEPSIALRLALVHATARGTAATIVFWHGLVPKLLRGDPDELAMLRDMGFGAPAADRLVMVGGVSEIAWALLLLVLGRHRAPWIATIVLMVIALGAVAWNSPRYLSQAFNPVTLNAGVIALAAIAWSTARDAPSAGRCRRTPPDGRGRALDSR